MITDWVDFIGSGYACHQKRRSGKASDEADIGPGGFPGIRKKRKKRGGREAREAGGLRWKERREGGRKKAEENNIVMSGKTIRDLSNSVPAAPRS